MIFVTNKFIKEFCKTMKETLNVQLLIEDIKKNDKLNEEEILNELSITKNELNDWLNLDVEINGEIYQKIKKTFDYSTSDLREFVKENEILEPWYSNVNLIQDNTNIDDIFKINKNLYDNIQKEDYSYYENSTNPKYNDFVQNKILTLKNLRINTRKPIISFNGKTSSGKSTLINTILGEELLSHSKQPETSALIKIIHSKHKPSYFKENYVGVFQKKFNPNTKILSKAVVDPMLLHDKKYIDIYNGKIGSSNLIVDYGAHRGKYSMKNENTFTTIVVYHDAPILEIAELWDVPGSHSTSERNSMDDIIAETVRQDADIRFYLSDSNGFLSDDQPQLKHEIQASKIIDENNPLFNLFVIATKANSIKTDEDFNEVIFNRINELWNYSGENFEKEISENYNKDITKTLIVDRVFFFEKESKRKNRLLQKQLIESLELYYKKRKETLLSNFEKDTKIFNKMIDTEIINLKREVSSNDIEADARKEYEQFLKHKDETINDYKELVTSIETAAKKYKEDTSKQLKEVYKNKVNIDYILSEIERKNLKDNKKDKSNFMAGFTNDLQADFENIIKNQLDDFSKETNSKIDEIESKQVILKNSFDYKANALAGLASIASIGAFSWYFSTLGNLGGYIFVSKTIGQLASLGIKVGRTANIVRGVSALGGPVTIAANIAIFGAQAAVTVYKKSTWKSSLSKNIIKQLEKSNNDTNYLNYIINESDKLWDETIDSTNIEIFIKQIEEEEEKLKTKMKLREQSTEIINILKKEMNDLAEIKFDSNIEEYAK
ncbi:hypothetical protein BUY93_12930 [Mammaliicoccus fleurettii]|nr:hypothetical protein BUY93_12930 [Mammaliicoccus fleurettii]